jgi:hypothetical protein
VKSGNAARFTVTSNHRRATAKRLSITVRGSNTGGLYIFSAFSYEKAGARGLTEAWTDNFSFVPYENGSAKRLAATFSYETPASPYKNTPRSLCFGYAEDRRAGFSYEAPAKLYGRMAARRLAAVFSYGNAGKL